MSETRVPNMLHVTSESSPEGLYVAVVPHPKTGEPTPYMEITYGTIEMWLAMSDGAVVLSEDEGRQLVLCQFDWIRKNLKSDDIEPGLVRLEGLLRTSGMLA
jgi:hypothetical protein